jgi:hypothetical protein
VAENLLYVMHDHDVPHVRGHVVHVRVQSSLKRKHVFTVLRRKFSVH